jgi:microsomal dipeptidase-like Zn-dependent dipeptidase
MAALATAGPIGMRTFPIPSYKANSGLAGWQDESEAGNVTLALRRRGHSEGDIARLRNGDVRRVLAAAAKARRPAR